MKFNNLLSVVSAFVVMSGVATTTTAATLTQIYTGNITEVFDSSDESRKVFNDSVTVGAQFSGSITYDDNDFVGSPTSGEFNVLSWDISFGDYYVKYTATGGDVTYKTLNLTTPSVTLNEIMTVRHPSSGTLGTYETNAGFVFETDTAKTVFEYDLESSAIDALLSDNPIGIIDLTKFDLNNKFGLFGLMTGADGTPYRSGGFNGTLTNLETVPVPAAVWLFGSGLLGLVGVARRKKA